MPSRITGDKIVSRTGTPAALPFQVVSEADLLDIDSVVNDQSLSGKQAGAMYLAETTTDGFYELVVAKGSSADSAWVKSNTDDAGAEVIFAQPA